MKPSRSQSDLVQRATDGLIQVVRIIRAAHPDKQQIFRVGYWIWISQYPEAEPYFRAAVNSVVKLNPAMLSETETSRWLMTSVVGPAVVADELNDAEFRRKCLETIDRLKTIEVYSELEIPVMHLDVRKGPFGFGDVRFVDLRPQSLKDDIVAGWAYELFDGRITCSAQVLAPGDATRRLDYTEERVQEALRILMGALWPLFSQRDQLLPVIVGHHPQPSATPFRQVGAQQFQESRGSFHAPGHWVRLPDHLREHWGQDGLEALLALAAGGFKGSDMAERVASGLGWLGEAVKPDILEARMVKVATALEALIGGEPKQEQFVTGRGITATLAERAAFLMEETAGKRLKVHKTVSDYYGRRSEVLHRRGTVTVEEVAAFGTLTWKVARSIVARLEKLPNLDALTKWVFGQRYS